MKIGSLTLSNPLILAPLAGITHMPFRVLAREAGCALVTSEMISANGLYYGSEETREMLVMSPAERPLAIQLFGQHPEIMADAAARVEAMGADMIDVNFGCAVKKIVRNGSGAALMRDLSRARWILEAMRSAIRIPLTIKMRSGWDGSGVQALELAKIAQDCGVNALTLHPRTAKQGFSGTADWRLIQKLKETVRIPVIGNGDIKRPSDVPAMMGQTGCDAVMVGRAAMGNPWFFSQALDALEGKPVYRVDPAARLELMRRYVDEMIALFGEVKACRMLRSRLGWFSRGLPASTHFRRSATTITHRADALDLIAAYEQQLREIPAG
jgi:nifR3 family TIM-barrel protein